MTLLEVGCESPTNRHFMSFSIQSQIRFCLDEKCRKRQITVVKGAVSKTKSFDVLDIKLTMSQSRASFEKRDQPAEKRDHILSTLSLQTHCSHMVQ